jgi:hypothetical protein
MLVGLPTAQAADTTLTLACEGTKTETSRYGGYSERRKAVSLSITVNFAARTVTGFREEERLVELTIDDISETTISFAGSTSTAMLSYNMNGTIGALCWAIPLRHCAHPTDRCQSHSAICLRKRRRALDIFRAGQDSRLFV